MFSTPSIRKQENEFRLIDEEACRICLESGPSWSMIRPCKCQGSIQHVHEKCLKTWIRFKDPGILLAKCEVCQYRFNISYTRGLVCDMDLRNCSHQNFSLVFKLTLLLIFVVFTFCLNLVYPEDGTNYSWFMIITNTIIVVSILVVLGVLIAILISPFLKIEPKNWKVLNYVPTNPQLHCRKYQKKESGNSENIDTLQEFCLSSNISELYEEESKDIYDSNVSRLQNSGD